MRIASLAAAAALAFGLAGCAGTPSPEPLPQPDATESQAPPAEPVGDLPCGVASADELAAVFGTDLGEGRERTSHTTQVQNVVWHPQVCVWEVDDLEVELHVADAAAFESGSLECVEPLGIGEDVQPVGGLGDQAWWEFDETDEGELRACTETHVLDVKVDGEGDFDARTAAIGLMELALAKVG